MQILFIRYYWMLSDIIAGESVEDHYKYHQVLSIGLFSAPKNTDYISAKYKSCLGHLIKNVVS